MVPGSRHRMAYTEPEVTGPWGSLPFTCQGRASWKPRHPRTASRFHRMDRLHTGPHLRHSFVRLGPGEALEMRLKLNGCSGAHTPAHAPQQPHPELGAPLSTMGLCAPSCGPLPKLAGQSAQEVGEKGVFLWEKKAAARLFRPTLRNTGSSGRDLKSKQLTCTHHSRNTQGVKTPLF